MLWSRRLSRTRSFPCLPSRFVWLGSAWWWSSSLAACFRHLQAVHWCRSRWRRTGGHLEVISRHGSSWVGKGAGRICTRNWSMWVYTSDSCRAMAASRGSTPSIDSNIRTLAGLCTQGTTWWTLRLTYRCVAGRRCVYGGIGDQEAVWSYLGTRRRSRWELRV